MDWTAAIDKHREALKAILATLVAMAGLPVLQACGGAAVAGGVTLPRRLHRALLALLRPAEAAARRLVIVAARGLVVEARRREPGGTGTPVSPGFIPPPLTPPLKGEGKLPQAKSPSPLRGSEGRASHGSRPGKVRGGGHAGLVHRPNTVRRRTESKSPRLGFRLFDPLPRWNRRIRQAAVPRISVPGFTAPFPLAQRREPSPHDPISAARLTLRLRALGSVLEDLPRHARRFARWQAAKAGAQQSGRPTRFRRTWPLRPGRPPGHRSRRSRRSADPVHQVLGDLQGLAVWALNDTS